MLIILNKTVNLYVIARHSNYFFISFTQFYNKQKKKKKTNVITVACNV